MKFDKIIRERAGALSREDFTPLCDDAIHKQYITHRVSQWSLFTNVPGMDPGCSLMQSCLLFKGHLLSIWDYISSQDAK